MPAQIGAQPEQPSQILSFSFGGARYGVSVLKVKEILQHERVTAVPGAPAFVRGVVDVRGAPVPIVDLGVKLGTPEVRPTKRTCVLVVETSSEGSPITLGVIADEVNEVVDLRAGDVLPPPRFGAGVKVPYLTGMAKAGSGNGFTLLLDLDLVLSASERELVAQSVNPGGPDPGSTRHQV